MRTLARTSIAALALGLVLPLTAFAANSEIVFTPDGTFTAKNILIYQKAGTNFFCRATWGTAFFRFVIVTSTSTVISKNHGERATAKDIGEQDLVDITGTLANGGDSMVINAKTIRDSNLQSAEKTFAGVVISVNSEAQTFVLNDKSYGKVTVSAGGAAITKGARSIPVADIQAGDKILTVPGTYDYTSNTLTATSVVVYQDGSVFLPRNFQGTLKSISGTTLPITAVVTVGATDYTVYVPAGASILKNSKASASLSRFVVGDTVRFYGVVRPTNLTEVDASVFRDLNF